MGGFLKFISFEVGAGESVAEGSGAAHQQHHGSGGAMVSELEATRRMLRDSFAFLSVPWRLEQLLFFGFLICLDSFLFYITLLPVRVVRAVLTFIWSICRLRPGIALTPQLADDLLRGTLLAVVLAMLFVPSWTEYSTVYHFVRGESLFKLYVLFNVLEVFDKLCCAFGQDVLDAVLYVLLYSQRGVVVRILVALASAVYIFGHACVIFMRVITLNVALNSENNALFTLLVSNNFVELKSFVFKRYGKENLFQITCSDIVERFHIVLYAFIMLIQNLRGFQYGGAQLIHVAMVWGCEVVTDYIKHAFIIKFNNLPVSIYSAMTQVLCVDVVSLHPGASVIPLQQHGTGSAAASSGVPFTGFSHRAAVNRRMGLVILPLVAVTIRCTVQALPDALASMVNLQHPPMNTCPRAGENWVEGMLCWWRNYGVFVAMAIFFYIVLVLLKLLTSILVLGSSCEAVLAHNSSSSVAQSVNPSILSPVHASFKSPHLAYRPLSNSVGRSPRMSPSMTFHPGPGPLHHSHQSQQQQQQQLSSRHHAHHQPLLSPTSRAVTATPQRLEGMRILISPATSPTKPISSSRLHCQDDFSPKMTPITSAQTDQTTATPHSSERGGGGGPHTIRQLLSASTLSYEETETSTPFGKGSPMTASLRSPEGDRHDPSVVANVTAEEVVGSHHKPDAFPGSASRSSVKKLRRKLRPAPLKDSSLLSAAILEPGSGAESKTTSPAFSQTTSPLIASPSGGYPNSPTPHEKLVGRSSKTTAVVSGAGPSSSSAVQSGPQQPHHRNSADAADGDVNALQNVWRYTLHGKKIMRATNIFVHFIPVSLTPFSLGIPFPSTSPTLSVHKALSSPQTMPQIFSPPTWPSSASVLRSLQDTAFVRVLLWSVAIIVLSVLYVLRISHSGIGWIIGIILCVLLTCCCLFALTPHSKYPARNLSLVAAHCASLFIYALGTSSALAASDQSSSFPCLVPAVHLLWCQLIAVPFRFQALPLLAAAIVPLATESGFFASPITIALLVIALVCTVFPKEDTNFFGRAPRGADGSGSSTINQQHYQRHQQRFHPVGASSLSAQQLQQPSMYPMRDAAAMSSTELEFGSGIQGTSPRAIIPPDSGFSNLGELSVGSTGLVPRMSTSGSMLIQRHDDDHQSMHSIRLSGSVILSEPTNGATFHSRHTIGPIAPLASPPVLVPTGRTIHPSSTAPNQDTSLAHGHIASMVSHDSLADDGWPRPSSVQTSPPRGELYAPTTASSSSSTSAIRTGDPPKLLSHDGLHAPGSKVYQEMIRTLQDDSRLAASFSDACRIFPQSVSSPPIGPQSPRLLCDPDIHTLYSFAIEGKAKYDDDLELHRRQVREMKVKYGLLKANFDEMVETKTKIMAELLELRQRLSEKDRHSAVSEGARSSQEKQVSDSYPSSPFSSNPTNSVEPMIVPPGNAKPVSQAELEETPTQPSITTKLKFEECHSGVTGNVESFSEYTTVGPTSTGVFTSAVNLSHEIRTPLTTAIAALDILLDHKVIMTEVDRLDLLQKAWGSLQRLHLLMENLLDAGRIGDSEAASPASLKKVAVRRMGIRALRVLEVQAKQSKIELVLEVDSKVPTSLLLNRPLMERTLINIISNAVSKAKENGRIVLRALWDASREYLQFAVVIHGFVLTAEELRAVFQPSLLREAIPSNVHDLGLTVGQRLITKMGGSVSAFSDPSQGTTTFKFEVYAPVASDIRASIDACVAVLDPDPLRRQALTALLQYVGLDVFHSIPDDMFPSVVFVAAITPTWKELLQQVRTRVREGAVCLVLPNVSSLRQDELALVDATLRSPVDITDLRKVLRKLSVSTESETSSNGSQSNQSSVRTIDDNFVILVAEDNEINFRLFARQLQSLGIQTIHRACNGVEAVDLAEKNRYAAIIMDCQMPIMDGYEATVRIRSFTHHLKTPILALTADQSEENKARCWSCGMTEFFTKPITHDKWQQMIRIARRRFDKTSPPLL